MYETSINHDSAFAAASFSFNFIEGLRLPESSGIA